MGPPVTHASHVLSPAHLKSKMLQNPRLAVPIVLSALSIGAASSPVRIHSSIAGVWINAAQFLHRAFFASIGVTPKIFALAPQNPLFGLAGIIGP